MTSLNKGNSFNTTKVSDAECDACSESEENLKPVKMKMECICPKCGRQHIENICWIGNGTPRKYCQACKGSF